jgi:hypothetical protein
VPSETLAPWQKRCRLLEELLAVYREIEELHSREVSDETGEASDRDTLALGELDLRSRNLQASVELVDRELETLPAASRRRGAGDEADRSFRLQDEILRLNLALMRRLEDEKSRMAREIERSTALRGTLQGLRPESDTPPFLLDLSA